MTEQELRREYKRLVISHADLTFAVGCARELRTGQWLADRSLPIDKGDGAIANALSHALIISYCRPFTWREDSGGDLEQVDYLEGYRETFTDDEREMHRHLVEDLRNKVAGHSDAAMSTVRIELDRDPPYVTQRWPGRLPLRDADLPVVEAMILKLRGPLRRRIGEMTPKLAEHGIGYV